MARVPTPARIIFTVAGILLMLVACDSASPVGDEASVIRVSHPRALAGTAWSLASIAGQPVPAAANLTIDFGPTDVSGNGGCNSYGASVRYDPSSGRIAIGDLVSTKRACLNGPGNALEGRFFSALRGVAVASMDPAGRLALTGSGPELVLVVAPQPAGEPVTVEPSVGPTSS